MAVAVDSEMASNVGDGVAAGTAISSPRTFSFTNTAGTLLVAIVGVSSQGSGTTSIGAVSYNGVAMTNLVEKSTGGANGGRIALFYLLSPATGANTFSYAFTMSGGTQFAVWAGLTSFTGNDLSTPFAQNTSATGSGTSATGTLSGCTAGNMTIAGAGAGSSFSSSTQTLSWAKNLDDLSSLGNGRASRAASSGTVTHSFTISASDSWATVIGEIAGAAAATTSEAFISLARRTPRRRTLQRI